MTGERPVRLDDLEEPSGSVLDGPISPELVLVDPVLRALLVGREADEGSHLYEESPLPVTEEVDDEEIPLPAEVTESLPIWQLAWSSASPRPRWMGLALAALCGSLAAIVVGVAFGAFSSPSVDNSRSEAAVGTSSGATVTAAQKSVEGVAKPDERQPASQRSAARQSSPATTGATAQAQPGSAMTPARPASTATTSTVPTRRATTPARPASTATTSTGPTSKATTPARPASTVTTSARPTSKATTPARPTSTATTPARPASTTPSSPTPAPEPQRFAWAPVPGATAYEVAFYKDRVQVFRSRTPTPSIVIAGRPPGTESPLAPGTYLWYVWPVRGGKVDSVAVVRSKLVIPAP